MNRSQSVAEKTNGKQNLKFGCSDCHVLFSTKIKCLMAFEQSMVLQSLHDPSNPILNTLSSRQVLFMVIGHPHDWSYEKKIYRVQPIFVPTSEHFMDISTHSHTFITFVAKPKERQLLCF